MSAPRVYKTEAIVLRQRRLGEADKILTLFSENHGKIDVIAKGVLKQGSRKAGHLEVLAHARLLLARGRNLDVVTQAETVYPFYYLHDQVELTSLGLYVAELLERFTADHQPQPSLFHLAAETLRRLDDGLSPRTVMRFFEMQLLMELGYQPELRRCVICGNAIAPVVNSFSPVGGGVVCPACTPAQSGLRPLSVPALKVLRLMQRGSFEDFHKLRVDFDLQGELEALLRAAMRVHLERDLNSVKFMTSVAPALR